MAEVPAHRELETEPQYPKAAAAADRQPSTDGLLSSDRPPSAGGGRTPRSAGASALRHAASCGSGSTSPKRVTFAPPPPACCATSTWALPTETPPQCPTAVAAAAPCGGSPLRRLAVGLPPVGPLPPLLPVAAPVSSRYALSSHDPMQPLTFMPEVDSPRHPPRSPLAALPLGMRRWPSNEALCASDDEISSTVDMSDLPPGTLPAGAPLARALWDLLPQPPHLRPLRQKEPADARLTAGAEPEAEADAGFAEWESSAAGKSLEHTGSAAAVPPPPPLPLAPATPTSQSLPRRLGSLLGRLLSAAATSGSSIAELAGSASGATLSPAGGSWCGSLYTAHSGSGSSLGSGGFGSASSMLELEDDRELEEAAGQEAEGEQYRWVASLASGFGCTPDPDWA